MKASILKCRPLLNSALIAFNAIKFEIGAQRCVSAVCACVCLRGCGKANLRQNAFVVRNESERFKMKCRTYTATQLDAGALLGIHKTQCVQSACSDTQ